jgi:hypothetical protein
MHGLARDEHGEHGKKAPDAHPMTSFVEATIHNVFTMLYGYVWTQPERGVQSTFIARAVERQTMRRVLVLACGLLWAVGCLWLPRLAAASELPVLRMAQADDQKSLAQVLKTIEQRFPGRALDAELIKQGQPTYRVKWLGDDGKVRDVTADAKSGQILDVK